MCPEIINIHTPYGVVVVVVIVAAGKLHIRPELMLIKTFMYREPFIGSFQDNKYITEFFKCLQ
jgi:hypothetical protein